MCSDLAEAEDIAAEPWALVEDVDRHLGVAKDSAYRWIEQKGLPGHRVGTRWKFKLSEINAWVHAGGAGQDEPDQDKENR